MPDREAVDPPSTVNPNVLSFYNKVQGWAHAEHELPSDDHAAQAALALFRAEGLE